MAARILSPDIARWRACSAQRAARRRSVPLAPHTRPDSAAAWLLVVAMLAALARFIQVSW